MKTSYVTMQSAVYMADLENSASLEILTIVNT